jgi:putative phosphoribosyl transferase
MAIRFKNRSEAGRLLASRLSNYANRSDVLVLALPRGGVPVAFEVAKALNAPLDLILVRKLGVPGQRELALGAIASGGVLVLNKEVIELLRITPEIINSALAEEQLELERREKLYRGDRPSPEVQGRVVILVDDGIATGSTIRAAIDGLKQQKPASIILAVPTAPLSICAELRKQVDDIVCLMTPEPFSAVGLWYIDFLQTTDEEVRYLLEQAALKHDSAHSKHQNAG